MPSGLENIYRSHHGTQVHGLIFSLKVHIFQNSLMHIPHGRFCPVGKNQRWNSLHTGIDLGKTLPEDRFRLRPGLPYHDRHATLENSSLFESDLVKGIAK